MLLSGGGGAAAAGGGGVCLDYIKGYLEANNYFVCNFSTAALCPGTLFIIEHKASTRDKARQLVVVVVVLVLVVSSSSSS